jgi:hypothetical protein
LLVDEAFVFAPDTAADWGKVGAYYDACLAARQTKVEYAKDMFRLWSAIWQDVPKEWSPVPPKPKDETLSLNPDLRWDEGYFERHFRLADGMIAALWVAFGDDGKELDTVEVVFNLQRDNRALRKTLQTEVAKKLPMWRYKHDALRMSNNTPYVGQLDVGPLRKHAKEALTVIASL